ncbi:MAG TPA: alpha/beta hydrolase domain-containing protein, partial [Acidimicrobiales bacterium]|nr:alpha/beta hydrolase domain-containing protein [Acidimicrobiales bacterium]
ERYGTLVHPGDAYAFDIFNQVGATATEPGGGLLGGLEPTQVIAVGESQSAIFLSTFVNAVHPLDPVYDGFLIHSRGANVAPLDGEFRRAADREDPDAALQDAVLIRTDRDEPVMLVETETDLTLLGYANARQPDTDQVRTWEVAGTAHADAHLIRGIVGGPRDPDVGSLLGCSGPVNTGPHHEVVSAALHQLVAWAVGDPAPPPGEPIELTDDDETTIARDEDGNALGGVRNPLVDVPVAALAGDSPGGATVEDLAGGEGDVCVLFGSTEPFDQATLVERYGTFDDYLDAFRASAETAVEAGYLLPHDADELITEAQANRALFG